MLSATKLLSSVTSLNLKHLVFVALLLCCSFFILSKIKTAAHQHSFELAGAFTKEMVI
jgi:hypothetical protein